MNEVPLTLQIAYAHNQLGSSGSDLDWTRYATGASSGSISRIITAPSPRNQAVGILRHLRGT